MNFVMPATISVLIIAGGPVIIVLYLIFPEFSKLSEDQFVLGCLIWVGYVVCDHLLWAEERRLRKGEREMMVFLHGEDKADAALRDYLKNKRFLPPEEHLDHPEKMARVGREKIPLNKSSWSEVEEDKLS